MLRRRKSKLGGTRHSLLTLNVPEIELRAALLELLDVVGQCPMPFPQWPWWVRTSEKDVSSIVHISPREVLIWPAVIGGQSIQ